MMHSLEIIGLFFRQCMIPTLVAPHTSPVEETQFAALYWTTEGSVSREVLHFLHERSLGAIAPETFWMNNGSKPVSAPNIYEDMKAKLQRISA